MPQRDKDDSIALDGLTHSKPLHHHDLGSPRTIGGDFSDHQYGPPNLKTLSIHSRVDTTLNHIPGESVIESLTADNKNMEWT